MDPAVKQQDDDVISKSLAFSRLKFHIYQSECSMNRAKKEQALKVLAICTLLIKTTVLCRRIALALPILLNDIKPGWNTTDAQEDRRWRF